MAILGNGSATTVHLALIESAGKNGKPLKRLKQNRADYGSRENLKGATISKKWHG